MHDDTSLDVTVLGDGPAVMIPVSTNIRDDETAEHDAARDQQVVGPLGVPPGPHGAPHDVPAPNQCDNRRHGDGDGEPHRGEEGDQRGGDAERHTPGDEQQPAQGHQLRRDANPRGIRWREGREGLRRAGTGRQRLASV